ncbi:MAG: DUF5696 domain-containing protein [Armatimonadota bacterium]
MYVGSRTQYNLCFTAVFAVILFALTSGTRSCSDNTGKAIIDEVSQMSSTDKAIFTASLGEMNIVLDPAKGSISIDDESAKWVMKGNRANLTQFALLSTDIGLCKIGGKGNITVNWSVDGTSISGTGKIPGLKSSFKIIYRLLSGNRLQCRIDLKGPDTGKVRDITFPFAPTVTGKESRLVVPQWLGLLVSPEGKDINVRRTVYLRPWCMRFIGATQRVKDEDRSYIAIVKDSFYRNVDIWREHNELGLNYVGDQAFAERSASSRSQSIEFQFIDGNYVSIAKRYREWAKKLPTWRTLASRDHPCDPKVVGGAILFAHVPCDYGGTPLSFDTLIPRMKALKEAGVERAMFHIGGWNREGYDAEYPDILPANPRCGGDEGMRRLTKAIHDLGYLCMPHDDIGIISTKAPSYDEKWLARYGDGSIINGGIYRDAQNYITSSSAQVHFAERNTPQVHERYPDLDGYLYDVTTSVQPIEDYSTNPPVSKEDNIYIRMGAFKATRDAFARFVIGESMMDWSIKYNDGGFMAEEGYYHKGDGGWALDDLHGEIVPIWELVYHDSHIGFRESTTHVNTAMETDDPLIRFLRIYLKTLRAGTVPPSFYSDDLTMNIIDSYIKQSKNKLGGWSTLNDPQMLAAVSRISTWLADDVFYDQMVDHAFIDGNLYHERTEFNGKGGKTVVYVNTDLNPWSPLPGVTLAPLGFLIQGPGFLAYHAQEIGGVKLSQPTLAAFKGSLKPGASIFAFRAFGDTSLPMISGQKVLHLDVEETGKTVSKTL